MQHGVRHARTSVSLCAPLASFVAAPHLLAAAGVCHRRAPDRSPSRRAVRETVAPCALSMHAYQRRWCRCRRLPVAGGRRCQLGKVSV